MSCKYKISVMEWCRSCGKREIKFKCKRISIYLGRFTCKSCKYYEEEDANGKRNRS